MSTAENPLRSGQLLVLPLAMVVGAFILWNQAEQTRKRGDPENSCLNHSANGVRNGNGGRANSYTRTVDVPPQLTEKEKEALAATAQALATRGKGILAADESTRTVCDRDCVDGQRSKLRFLYAKKIGIARSEFGLGLLSKLPRARLHVSTRTHSLLCLRACPLLCRIDTRTITIFICRLQCFLFWFWLWNTPAP